MFSKISPPIDLLPSPKALAENSVYIFSKFRKKQKTLLKIRFTASFTSSKHWMAFFTGFYPILRHFQRYHHRFDSQYLSSQESAQVRLARPLPMLLVPAAENLRPLAAVIHLWLWPRAVGLAGRLTSPVWRQWLCSRQESLSVF
jgi:hypothetical protein